MSSCSPCRAACALAAAPAAAAPKPAASSSGSGIGAFGGLGGAGAPWGALLLRGVPLSAIAAGATPPMYYTGGSSGSGSGSGRRMFAAAAAAAASPAPAPAEAQAPQLLPPPVRLRPALGGAPGMCPGGKRAVNCFADPCFAGRQTRCPAGSTCVSAHGCHALRGIDCGYALLVWCRQPRPSQSSPALLAGDALPGGLSLRKCLLRSRNADALNAWRRRRHLRFTKLFDPNDTRAHTRIIHTHRALRCPTTAAAASPTVCPRRAACRSLG